MKDIFAKLIFPLLFISVITFGVFLLSNNNIYKTDNFILDSTLTSPFKNPQQITNFANNILTKANNFFVGFGKKYTTTSSLLDYETNVVEKDLNEEQERENLPKPAKEEVEEVEGIGGPIVVPMTPDDLQNILDDIQEKIDIISYQVEKLIVEQKEKEELEKPEEDEIIEEDEDLADNICLAVNINTATASELEKIIGVGPSTAQKIISARPFYSLNDLLRVGGIGEKTLQKIKEQSCAYVDSGLIPPPVSSGSSGVASIIYPKILISEVKIAEKTGDKNIFIELFNPNNTDIDLTNWYIFRNSSSFIAKSMFAEKKILANSYFLLVKEGSLWSEEADLIFTGTLNNNDNIFLKNPSGDIADQSSWSEINTALSWCYDFIFCLPTPSAPNIKWEELEPEPEPEQPILDPDPESTPVLKVLINEIQIFPIEQRFIELYNPNSSDIDLTGWYLQRKTKTADSWSSFVSSTNFEGKIILAGGHFLISREIVDSDIFLDITLSNDNSLVLKNLNREIVDKVGWGEAIDFENMPALNLEDEKSIGRTNGIDTDDNSVDFLIFSEPSPESTMKK